MTLNAYLWNPREFHGLYGIRPLPEERAARGWPWSSSPRVAGDVDGNLERIAHEAAALAAQGCDLVVFPELAVTGPVADRETAERLAEVIPGPSTRRLRQIAATAKIYLVAGLIERDAETGQLYNSAVLVGPDGYRRDLPQAAPDRRRTAPGRHPAISVCRPSTFPPGGSAC